MKIEQFIGIFPNAIHEDLCFEFVKWFGELHNHGLTMSAMEQTGMSSHVRNDQSVFIPTQLPFDCFPEHWLQPLWQSLRQSSDLYVDKYALDQPMTSHTFKIHQIYTSGGYHVWHHEHGYANSQRVLAWMIVIEAPKRGGETEFLYQSMRVEPKVGQLLIWPAGFTHKHRGNPPLEGQKTYITGWFSLVPPPQQ